MKYIVYASIFNASLATYQTKTFFLKSKYKTRVFVIIYKHLGTSIWGKTPLATVIPMKMEQGASWLHTKSSKHLG